ncbi:MAG: 23S rRNA (uracil(1939)-C(5))-methyltransferase RlmD [Spirochaetaceae bacterium]|nr:23S rRNA (uracil(1939)-C(5))-methyltransferase RlmD [Spirochaetaceae bacterium]
MKKYSVCPLAHKCGGCQLQSLSYKDQLNYKMDEVYKALDNWGRIAPIVPMDNPTNYRNKTQVVFDQQKGKIVSGIYQSGTHRVISIHDCMIQDEESDQILQTIRHLMKKFSILPYNEDNGRGVIRHVLIRKAIRTNQVMVVLICGSPIINSLKTFVSLLKQEHSNIKSILLNYNDGKTSMVLSDDPEQILYGKGYIEDELCGMKFRISPKSFYQVNSVQAEKMYNIVMNMARLNKDDVVLDAYCGTGTIGLIAAKQGIKKLIGVEVNAQAVDDARLNAFKNGIENAEFVCADASQYISELAASKEKIDVLFMDPPRSGSDTSFLISVLKLSPKTIVYISCNMNTLDRDLKILNKSNEYDVVGIQPIDMFPYTTHIENIVLLTRYNKNDK